MQKELTMVRERNSMSRLALFCSTLFIMGLSTAAHAATVSGLKLQQSGSMSVVHINMDQKMNYEVFDLTDPVRVVLSIPGAKLGSSIEPVKTNGANGVTSVFPVQTPAGVRIEIGMQAKEPYKIVEKGNNLEVRVQKPAQQAAASAPAAKKARIKDIQVYDSGSMTELVLQGDHLDANHDAFLTNKGQTMILDFWGATSLLPKEHYSYSTQRVNNVTVGQSAKRVRLVVSLLPAAKTKYQIEDKPHQMVIRFGNVLPPKRAGGVTVDSVNFQPEDRISHIVIRTDSTTPVFNMYKKDGDVLIDVRKAKLAPGQERTQDVREFPGPINQIDSYQVNNKVRIVARLREKVEMSSYQQGNLLTVTLVPEDIAQAQQGAAKSTKFAYTGQKVTFDFKDIDIRNALKLIAEMSKLNIIMSDDVKGKLTMRLVDVPWDQALDLILEARGLGKEQQGNVIRIAPIDVLRKEYKAKLEAQQGSTQLEPLVTEFIRLSYTKVADVKKMLDNASANATRGGTPGSTTTAGATASSAAPTMSTTAGASGQQSSVGILSPRGSFLIDERTNTLIVKDTIESINNVKRLIAAIDKPVKQVLIEARIVEAKEDFTRSFGIRWGGQTNYNNVGGNVLTIGGAQGSGTPYEQSGGTTQTVNKYTAGPGWLIDMPAATYSSTGAGGAIGMLLGTLNFNLALELSAAENNGEAKVISNPRLITSNLKQATISQGVSIPVTTPQTNTSPATVQYQQANLSLQVTPQITADNKVIMDITVTKDAPSTTIAVNGNPGIDTKSITTSAFLANGETVVIGGIYQKSTGNQINKVPGLGDIPILGWLFKNKAVNDNRTELLIFLTPTIIQPISAQEANNNDFGSGND
jgi:type IV pilus assembly protein PilQ